MKSSAEMSLPNCITAAWFPLGMSDREVVLIRISATIKND